MIQEALGALLVRPYQFQIESAQVLWEARYGLSADEMGLGKSLEAIICAVAHMDERPDAKIIFCVPAFLKANWYREIEKFTLHIRVKCCITAKDIPDCFKGIDAVVINYEQLDKTKHLFRKATMVVVDECFVAGTLVDTPSGKVKIEDVVPGQKILNCSGEDEVVCTSESTADTIIRINKDIECTENHPFFTQRGWIQASKLKKGDYLVTTDEAMRMVQSGSSEKRESFLQSILLSEMENVSAGNTSKGTQQGSGCKNSCIEYGTEKTFNVEMGDRKQLHVQREIKRKDAAKIVRNWTQALGARWKRAWPNKVRKNGNGNAWKRLGLQPCSNAEQAPLQSRYCQSERENSNRSGWKIALPFGKKGAGCKEGSVVKRVRVESITVEKCGSRVVYNLQVKKHPSYSVNGVLVHNCHYLKTFDSKRTEIFTDYIRDFRPDRLLLLSGTPIKNRVPEYYSLIRLLDLNHRWTGARLGRELCRYVQFCEFFCFKEERIIPGKRFPRVKYIGFKNQDNFFSLLTGRYVRHLAKDVLDLPPIMFQDIITKTMPDPKEAALNEELEELWNDYLMGIQTESLSSRKLENALLKVPYTVQFVKELLEAGVYPVLVFTDHVKPAELIGKTWGAKSAFITGQTPVPQRDLLVRKFQNGELDVLAATTSTMSAGWTLTRATRCVFNDKPWVPGDFMQAIKRIHRIGQTEVCFIYNIVTTKLDQMIMGTLKSKIETLTQALRKSC